MGDPDQHFWTLLSAVGLHIKFAYVMFDHLRKFLLDGCQFHTSEINLNR